MVATLSASVTQRQSAILHHCVAAAAAAAQHADGGVRRCAALALTIQWAQSC